MRVRQTLVAGLLAALSLGTALAQGFTGTYTTQGDLGPVTLTLTEDGTGYLSGTLAGGDTTFELAGYLFDDGSGVGGVVYTPQGELGFEAYLEGATLGFYLFEFDGQGNAVVETATEIIMTRQGGATPAANPLAGPGSSNPLAAGDPLVGHFSDGAVVLELTGGGGSYRGQLVIGGQSYPVTAQGSAASLSGSFTAGGTTYLFTASLQGGTLTLTSDGTRYQLRREGAPAGGNPLGTGPTPNPGGELLAQGVYASLSRDNALAFIEAFEFSLAQAGYAYSFSQAERQQMLELVAQSFPTLSQEEQLILAQARQIWSQTQQNWAVSSEADKRAFVLAVFRLALGEQAVQQLAGSGGGGGGGGGCATFEDCAGAYMDGDTWSDTNNAMSCWAAAGCGGYDAGTDTFYDTGGDYY